MHEDAWESEGWETDELDRDEVLRLARQLAAQRERIRAEELAELEELKRELRERAADVAARELEVERQRAELEERAAAGRGEHRSLLRLRRERPPESDPDRPGAEELLARREADVAQRSARISSQERKLQDRFRQLEQRTAELDEHASMLAAREAELERAQADEQEVAAGRATTDDTELAMERDRLAGLARDLDERERMLEARIPVTEVRQGEPRDQTLAEREATLRARESALASRDAELARTQATLAARDEELRRRARSLDDLERLRERAAVLRPEPYVSFSEGLDALAEHSEPPPWR